MSKRAADINMDADGVESKRVCVQTEKKRILENEANARSLSKTKVMYSRRGDEEDTFIVRDLHPGTNFDRFGFKGVEQLERICFVILSVLSEHRTMLLKRMRFGGDTLRDLLDGLSDIDREDMRTIREKFEKSACTTKIALKHLDTCPQLEIKQYKSDGKLSNGMYLFIGDAVTVVKHMNTVFEFSSSKCLKFVEKEIIEKYTDDNFF